MPAVTYESIWQLDPMEHPTNEVTWQWKHNRKCSRKTVTWGGNDTSHNGRLRDRWAFHQKAHTWMSQSAAVMFSATVGERGFCLLKKDRCNKNIAFPFVKASCAFIKPSWSSLLVWWFGYFSVKNRKSSKSFVLSQTKPSILSDRVLHDSHTLHSEIQFLPSGRRLLVPQCNDPVIALLLCSLQYVLLCAVVCTVVICLWGWMTLPTGAGSESK